MGVLAVIVPSVSSAAFENNLFYGSKGQEVAELQEFLTDQGLYSGPLSGNFYSLTQTAVKKFQAKYAISPTSGYFGVKSRAKANELLAASTPVEEETPTAEAPTAPDISALLLQLTNLQEQIKQIQQNQVAEAQKQTQALETIKNNTTPVLGAVEPVLEVRKEATAKVDWCDIKNGSRVCSISVSYSENGKVIVGASVTMTADDQGAVYGEGTTNVRAVNDFTKVASFLYFPAALGTRTLTATVNGVSATITTLGKE